MEGEVPVLIAWDAAHGASYVKGATIFPHQINAGASFSRWVVMVGSSSSGSGGGGR